MNGDEESKLSSYKVDKLIGKGNFGMVHLCYSITDGKKLVIKRINLNELSEKEREGALQEVEVLRTLRSPAIVSYTDSFILDNTLHLVMPYCEGGDLHHYIKRATEPLEESEILRLFYQICVALKVCHDKRIVHRDIKSQNIFLTRKREVKLGDFGIARILGGTNELAKTVVGTPYSMSPEVCESKPYGFASDVWSLGCVLYEMCMRKHAFDADNLLGLVWKIVQENYSPIPSQYSSEMNELIRDMLSKDPEKRPTVEEILQRPIVERAARDWLKTRSTLLRSKRRTHSSNTHRPKVLNRPLSSESNSDLNGSLPSPRSGNYLFLDNSTPRSTASSLPSSPHPRHASSSLVDVTRVPSEEYSLAPSSPAHATDRTSGSPDSPHVRTHTASSARRASPHHPPSPFRRESSQRSVYSESSRRSSSSHQTVRLPSKDTLVVEDFTPRSRDSPRDDPGTPVTARERIRMRKDKEAAEKFKLMSEGARKSDIHRHRQQMCKDVYDSHWDPKNLRSAELKKDAWGTINQTSSARSSPKKRVSRDRDRGGAPNSASLLNSEGSTTKRSLHQPNSAQRQSTPSNASRESRSSSHDIPVLNHEAKPAPVLQKPPVRRRDYVSSYDERPATSGIDRRRLYSARLGKEFGPIEQFIRNHPNPEEMDAIAEIQSYLGYEIPRDKHELVFRVLQTVAYERMQEAKSK